MAFDLSKYEPVKARKTRFRKDHPDGRIVPEHVDVDDKHALIRAYVYKSAEDQANSLPLGSGYAYELRDLEKSKSKYGTEYESVNYSAWVENCEESAVGRALDNAGYASNGKCSQEEMKKVVAKATVAKANMFPDPEPAPVREILEPAEETYEEITQTVGGSYEITFGKYKGSRLSQVPLAELISYKTWMVNDSRKKGKKMSDRALEFVREVDTWTTNPQAESNIPQQVVQDDIPF